MWTVQRWLSRLPVWLEERMFGFFFDYGLLPQQLSCTSLQRLVAIFPAFIACSFEHRMCCKARVCGVVAAHLLDSRTHVMSTCDLLSKRSRKVYDIWNAGWNCDGSRQDSGSAVPRVGQRLLYTYGPPPSVTRPFVPHRLLLNPVAAVVIPLL